VALELVAVGADALGRERLGPGVGTEELAERAVDAGVGLARQLGGLTMRELGGDRAQRAGVEQLAASDLDACQLRCRRRRVGCLVHARIVASVTDGSRPRIALLGRTRTGLQSSSSEA
jgi:hypothetical protein